MWRIGTSMPVRTAERVDDIGELANLNYIVNFVVNRFGEPLRAFCGHRIWAHRAGIAYGDPSDPANYMGPLISARQREMMKLAGLARLREGAFSFELTERVPPKIGAREIEIETLSAGINPQEMLLDLFPDAAVVPEARELAGVLLAQSRKMQEAVRALRNMKDTERILAACREINSLENQADTLLRTALAKLFKGGGDALMVMKWKEILDLIETATDRAEDVANVLEGVVLENA